MDSIIFDLDGTLWDARIPVREAWTAEVEAITGAAWSISDEEYNALFGQPMDVIARALFPNEEDEERRLSLAQRCYDREIEVLRTHHGLLFPGAEETLRKLSETHPLYIVSNCQKGYIEVMLETTGLKGRFKGWLCYGDTQKSKDVTIRTLMEREHLTSPVYVGDTQGDADACRDAEVPFIYAEYGFGTVERPDRTLSDIAKLPDLLSSGEKAKKPAEKLNWKKELLSWVLTIGIPVAVILFLNAFVGKLVIVNGTSMFSTLYDRDLLIVQSVAYTPKQGDIVICKTPADGPLHGENIVKRCIAVEGQTVTIDYDTNTVTVDGVTLDEPYLYDGYGDTMIEGYYTQTEYTVPEGCIFIMGDNRNNSEDSRGGIVGMVDVNDVIGRDVLRIPVGKLIGDNSNP